MKRTLCLLVVLALPLTRSFAWEREDYEEPGPGSFAVLLNPEDDVYGIHFGSSTWLVDAPIIGEYFLTIFNNGIEDGLYSGFGMTLRLMPRWRVAPFLGGGGSYNVNLSEPEPDIHETLENRGDPYAAGHVETGLRILTEGRYGLFEIMLRYTWSALDGDRDYWLIGISIGAGDTPADDW